MSIFLSISKKKRFKFSKEDIRKEKQVIEEKMKKILEEEQTSVNSEEKGEKELKNIANAILLSDPLNDIENENFIKNKKGKDRVECPNCFLIVTTERIDSILHIREDSDFKKTKTLKIPKDNENLIICPNELIEAEVQFKDCVEGEQILFNVKCKNCKEALGFYSFNLNETHLLRFL